MSRVALFLNRNHLIDIRRGEDVVSVPGDSIFREIPRYFETRTATPLDTY
jgi:hypothetical protein